MSATKIRNEQLNISDGWIPALDTWTYASATTFTIAGVDRTAMFPKGTKIKLTQTTAKYFYVTAAAFSTDTTITVTGGTDYTLANATITSPYYSYASSPQGFPQWFAYTPTIASEVGTFTTVAGSGKFSLVGKVAFVNVVIAITNKGTASYGITATFPITGSSQAMNFTGRQDATTACALTVVNYDTTKMLIKKYDGTTAIDNGYTVTVSGHYEIA